MKAVANRVLVKEDAPETVSKGGVTLVAAAQREPNRGVVVSVGPRVKEPILEGAIVHYTVYDGLIIGKGDEALVSLVEGEILAMEIPEP